MIYDRHATPPGDEPSVWLLLEWHDAAQDQASRHCVTAAARAELEAHADLLHVAIREHLAPPDD